MRSSVSLQEKTVGDLLTLEVLEAFMSKGRFYLPEKNRVRVLDERTRNPYSLQELVRKFSVGKPTIWTKYLVYRDLRDRGYLVRVEDGGFDFETFGKGATRRLVSIVFEGGESTLDKLARLSARANKDT